MRIIRVFPRRTRATPDDDLVRIGNGPGLFDEADAVHVSVTFTWDLSLAERLAKAWGSIAPVSIGGPAMDMAGGDFVPGLYVKPGYVITSRGCPNRCWFCSVWKREGKVRELPITEGWNVLDDNLLACSDGHISKVFEMLRRQSEPIEFTGGLEAARLKTWHAAEMKKLRIKQIFFAYDTPCDLDPLRRAGQIMIDAGFAVHPTSHALRCFVLCGFHDDTIIKAKTRMEETKHAGFTPMAMLYRDAEGKTNREWRIFQREWARPAIIYSSSIEVEELP